ncbi:MAG: phosphoadenosine phosphosulfate reductase family protein [Xenococcaceae cyanobacterium]
MQKQLSLFEDDRTTQSEAITITTEYLKDYFSRYNYVAIAYSGGKDSSATVSLILHLIETLQVPRPRSLTVIYADTRLELPPLHEAAMAMLREVERRGFNTKIAIAPVAKRFLPYILGRGVTPPNNSTLRWCTQQIKVGPMNEALAEIRDGMPGGDRLLMIAGVRIGESAVRDRRILTSCSTNGAECGQGWFQNATYDRTDTFAPILHWRVCQVREWLITGELEHGFPTYAVAEAYGGDEAQELNARTGCIGCPLADKETALDALLSKEKWSYLAPLKNPKPIYREMRLFENRLQKDGNERKKDGTLVTNPGRKGPLTLDARTRFLDRVLAIQLEINERAINLNSPQVFLIDVEEEEFIRDCISNKLFPNKWTGDERNGNELLPQVYQDGSIQNLLLDW